jgi:cytochrome o ubiquinol oxidase operon protein cyoD
VSQASETGIETHAEGAHDVAPGDERLGGDALAKGLIGYVIGLGLAGGLTIASFVIPASGLVWAPAIPVALIVFAIAQMGVHLVFFIHMSTGPDNTNNALALAFGVLIVVLVIGGSLWIMAHLDHNMLPMNQLMQMQS